MGTETKFNGYSEKSSTGSIPKVLVKGSSSETVKTSINKESSPIIVNGKESLLSGSPKSSSSLSSTTARASPVPFVPVYIAENNAIEGAKQILKVIRPHWNLNTVQFKNFTDGITNKLVGCFNIETNTTKTVTIESGNTNSSNGSNIPNTNGDSENDDDDNNARDHHNDSGNLSDAFDTDVSAKATNSSAVTAADNVVLIRIYGNKTDLLIDRKAETRNFKLLHTYGFAPSLYATFKNGLAYDYVPGVTLNTESVLRPEVWHLVARRMAEMHRVVNAPSDTGSPGGGKPDLVPMVWKKTQSFLDLVPERFSDADKHKRLEGTFLPISRMRDEFSALYERLAVLGSPLVFSHNDLLLGNVIYTESRQSVSFIDYEYADYNFQAFDIGNHFAEFAGVDEVNYALYPQREFQLEWLRIYLQTYLQRPQVTEAEVERLYVQVNQFALAAHFFWTIWCLIQAEHSTIDFDYVDYAFVRYNEYLAKKDEFLALNEIESSR